MKRFLILAAALIGFAAPPAQAATVDFAPASVATDAPQMRLVRDGYLIGSPDAPITITEYASPTCPHCARFHATAYPELYRRYIEPGHVRLHFRFHPYDELARAAAMVASCKGEPLTAARIMDRVFATQDNWTTSGDILGALLAFGTAEGVSEDRTVACLKNPALGQQLERNVESAQNDPAMPVQATPTFIIDVAPAHTGAAMQAAGWSKRHFSGAQPIGAFAQLIDPILAAIR